MWKGVRKRKEPGTESKREAKKPRQAIKNVDGEMLDPTHVVGDDTERWFLEFLHEYPQISNVELVSMTNSKYDIIFQLIGEEKHRAIQCKTLCLNGSAYSMTLSKQHEHYPDDLLIVGANTERSVFCAVPYGVVKHMKGPSFAPIGIRSEYTFADKKEFKARFQQDIKSTTSFRLEDFHLSLSPACAVEYQSLQRLEKICGERKLQFQTRKNNWTRVDFKIERFTIQCKASHAKTDNFFHFTIEKWQKSTQCKVPYHADDPIDFFIFNMITVDDPNRFYIIPKNILVRRGYLTSSASVGKAAINLPMKDYEPDHWSKEFLDNYPLFTNSELRATIGLLPFEKECVKRNLAYRTAFGKTGDLRVNEINGKKIRFLLIRQEPTETGIIKLSTRCHQGFGEKPLPYHENDPFDVWVYQLPSDPAHYWIAPKALLKEKKCLRTSTKKGQQQLTIRSPSSSEPSHWSVPYWNNFSVFV